jgi:glycosyltransferase involved in cell wall biosynthesis
MPGAVHQRPLISVVMPVRDAGAYLAPAIESILAQTLRDFEFIIVDDGSTDASVAVIAEYARRDGRIRLYQQRCAGIVAALNRGLAESSAELVARMDADDIASVDRFERQATFLSRHPQVGVVGGATLLVRRDGRPIRTVQYPLDDAGIRRLLRRRSAIAHPAALIRAAPLRELGGYRRAFITAQDYDLWLRLGERAELANLPETVLQYRMHPSQLSESNIEQQVLGGIGARYSARMRAEHRADPMDAAGPLSLDLVARLGVSVCAVKNDVVSTLAQRALFFAQIGERQMACRLLSEAIATAAGVELRAGTRSNVAAAQAYMLALDGRLGAAIQSLLLAMVAHPPSVAWLAWRGVRQAIRGARRRS